jgi:serine/threonine-protein kinase
LPNSTAAGGDPLSGDLHATHDLSGAILEGTYRLVRLIGKGGMGVVYEAVQLRLNKRVAVKIMSRDHAANTVSLARFHREAEITSRLGHPHLVSVIDFGTAASGEPYLVMELLDGEDLEMRLNKLEHLPLEATIRITRQAASALGAAHAQDVVHRDMKPANIFLMQVPGEQEFVKVLDFGISKMKAAGAKLTRASAVVGSPIYMSPEQTLGKVEDTDHRADQWALACIAWEMISGQPPFDGENVNALFYQINRVEPRPLVHHYPSLSRDVEQVLRKALSKNVAERYPSIRDFGYALDTAAFGRYADRTPPVAKMPSQWAEELRTRPPTNANEDFPVADAGPGVAQDSTAGAEQAGQAVPPAMGLLRAVSWARPAWRKPILAAASAACILVLVAGAFLWRSSSATARSLSAPASAFPASAQAGEREHSLPLASATTATSAVTSAIPLAASSGKIAPIKKAKSKPARTSSTSTRTSNPQKPKAPNPQSKSKIFREL